MEESVAIWKSKWQGARDRLIGSTDRLIGSTDRLRAAEIECTERKGGERERERKGRVTQVRKMPAKMSNT